MRGLSFRLGVVIGGLAGYVLGARAGRQRYEQIARAARSAARSKPAQQLNTEVRSVASRAGDLVSSKASEGANLVVGLVKDTTVGNGQAGDGPPQPR
jgi:hypothetical protein